MTCGGGSQARVKLCRLLVPPQAIHCNQALFSSHGFELSKVKVLWNIL